MDIYTELDNFVEENEGQVTLTDVAKHFAEYGYKYAIEDAIYHIKQIYVQYNFKLPSSFEEDLKDRMEE